MTIKNKEIVLTLYMRLGVFIKVLNPLVADLIVHLALLTYYDYLVAR